MKTKVAKNCKSWLLPTILVAILTTKALNAKAEVQAYGDVFTNQSFNNGEPYYQLIVGATSSNAGLTVNGGTVFDSDDLILGLGSSTNNFITVTGAGSKLICPNLSSGGDTYTYAYGNIGIRGYNGNEDYINVSDGGGIECVGNTFEGEGQIGLGTNNTMSVTDIGSFITFNYGLKVIDRNSISVLNGATLGGPGISLGSSNAVLFSGFGTSVDTGLGGISGGGFNSLAVSNGALLNCYSVNFSGVGNILLFNGSETRCFATNGISSSGTIYTNGDYFAGYGSGGMITIKNGAQITIGGLYSSGNPAEQMIVSDNGTLLTITSLGYLEVGVGYSDTNAILVVTNGASVVLHNDCLMNGQVGLLQIIGTNSSLTGSTNGIYIGGGGGGNSIQIGVGGQIAVGNLQIGYAGNAVSNSISVAGCLFVTNSAGTAVFELHDARATCDGGLIVADQLICGLGGGLPGILTVNSGTLQFKSAVVTNGLSFVIGDGTNSARLILNGGKHLFANGLVISSNATFLGSGVVIGAVTNYGNIQATGGLIFSNLVVNLGSVTTAAGNGGDIQFSSGLISPAVVWNLGSDHNNHTYQVFYASEGIDWDVAESNAVAMGGHLVSITSAEENNFVYSLASNNTAFWIRDFNGNGLGPWIGAIQPPDSPEPAGGWEWIDGCAFAYSNWAPPFEPNNLNGIEDRAILFAYQGQMANTWDDYPNSPTPPPVGVQPKPFAYIVEFQPVQLPVILSALPEDADLRLYWQGQGGNSYVLQASTNLAVAGSFSDVSPVITLSGLGTITTNYIDIGTLTNSPVRFYRVRSN